MKSAESVLEWIAFGVNVLLVITLLGLLGYERYPVQKAD